MSYLNSFKQDTLVSGTNIKTINGSSILGSGNLVVSSATTWGSITGTLSSQTDLNTALSGKQNTITTGTTSEYFRGDLSLATFPTIPTVTPSALTQVDDTNVTITLGGTPATALLQPVSITAGWTGTLADSRIASATNWNTAYTNRITSLTTTGSSGSATLSSNTLNIPTYTLAGLGGVPTSRTLTINGSTQDLSADRTFTIANPEGWTVIVKSANQDVTNSGATDDTELQFSVVANGTYMVDITLAYSGNNTTGDYAFSFGITAGTLTGRVTYQSITTAGAAFNGTSAAVTSSFFVGVASADLTVVENARILATFRASANATFKMQIGQASPAAGRISRAWKGSILKYKRLD